MVITFFGFLVFLSAFPGNEEIVPGEDAQAGYGLNNCLDYLFDVFFLPKVPDGDNEKTVVAQSVKDLFEDFFSEFSGGEVMKSGDGDNFIKLFLGNIERSDVMV